MVADLMRMDAQLFRELVRLAGLSPEHLPSFLGLSRRQVRRYLAGTVPVPVAVNRLLWLRAGALGGISSVWAGWRLVPRRGELVSPQGHVWTVEQILGLHWHHEQLAAERAALRAEIADLRAQLDALTRTAEKTPPLRLIKGGLMPE